MTLELVAHIYNSLPIREKFLVPIGATISWASIALAPHLSVIATLVGILVGLATLALTILRICSAWSDLRKQQMHRYLLTEQARQDMEDIHELSVPTHLEQARDITTKQKRERENGK